MLQKAADAAALAGAQELPLDSIEAEKYARDVAIKNEILDVNTIVEFA